jgi:RNA polymerase sigma-70 factor, ECF subfamily
VTAPATLEGRLRRLAEAGDLAAAATLAVETYGPEIYGYLVAVARDDDTAAEVYAELCHDLWRDLPRFKWESSLRTWAYTVARHRLIDALRDPARRRRTPLSQAPEVDALIARTRTTTATWQRSEVKAGVARLRERLDPDDQTLLILRVDRGLGWRDVAAIMGDKEPALRKRYERLKERLREMAKDEKLVP